MSRFSRFLRGYYYLTPLWYLIESCFWPNFRAGVLTGHSQFGLLSFYGIESAIGLGLWYNIPIAEQAALFENVLLLITGIKFIMISPIDWALNVDGPDPGQVAQAAAAYVQAMPGTLNSLFQVCNKIYWILYKKPFPLKSLIPTDSSS